jgi:glycosyltransferase involved in cell wall biosynthesis
MKISYIIDRLYNINAGTERQLHRLIEGMLAAGHSVDLYVLRDTDYTWSVKNFPESVKKFPCKITNLNIQSIFSVRCWNTLWKLRNKLESDGCKVLHGFFNDVALTIPIAFLFSKIKVYTSRRDMGIWYSALSLLLLRLTAPTATQVICNSKAVAKHTADKEWKSMARIAVIYNGISPLQQQSSSSSSLPEWYRPSQNPKAVLIANLRPVKRIEDLINAAHKLAIAGLSVDFYIVGDFAEPTYYDFLNNKIAEHGLEENIFFTGLLAEPREHLHLFDIGVLTSESEGLSNSILDSLDAGLPVIASHVGGNPELIEDGENGLLYNVGDSDQLADCIELLASDPGMRAALSQQAKQKARRFDMQTMIRLHEAEYIL